LRNPSGPFENQQALPAARVRNRGPTRSLRGTVSIPKVVSKRSVKWAEQASQSQKCSRRRSFRRLLLNAELRSVGQVSARNSLPSRRERNGIVHVGLAHLCSMTGSDLLFSEFLPESSKHSALERPNTWPPHEKQLIRGYCELDRGKVIWITVRRAAPTESGRVRRMAVIDCEHPSCDGDHRSVGH